MSTVNEEKGEKSAVLESDAGPEELWKSRASFILAAVGSAIGLGNFWRFPFLCFRWGGGTFFIPYLIALIFVGIPLIQLELAVGQVFRRAATQGFAGLDQRFRGIGLAAGFLAFVLLGYYMVILGWSNVFLINSFQSTEDIPWNINGEKGENATSIPSAYFNGDVLGYSSAVGRSNEDSTVAQSDFEFGNIVWDVTFGAMFMWAIVFVILYKGAESVGKAVYVTVLLPVGMLIILLIVGITLEGAGTGITQYIGVWDMSLLSDGDMWVDAFGQIFFSLGLSLGVMSAYGSLNPRNSNVVKDAAIIALLNCTFSFIAGFAVFAIVGYFVETTGLTFSEIQGILGGPSLTFVTYPAALTLIGTGAEVNILLILFFMMLFFLGVDSAFSLVDSVVLNFREIMPFGAFTRLQMTGLVCIVGAISTMFYCTDVGLQLLDIVDDYLAMGLLLLGFFESVLAGWIHKRDETAEIVGQAAHQFWEIGVCGGFVVFCSLSLIINHESDIGFGGNFGISIAVGGSIMLAGFFLAKSKATCENPVDVLMYHGTDSLRETLNAVITEDAPENMTFGRPWGLLIKFFMTPIIFYLLLFRIASRMKSGGYWEYETSLQILGLLVTGVCLTFIAVGFASPATFAPPAKV